MYDALLVVSFGGPEKRDDVLPFLENVTRGRNVPGERLLEVAEHYYHFDGRSPINDQCRALIAALHDELNGRGPSLPIYWGNRNWHPFLTDTMRQMRDAGIRHAAAFVTSAYSSYSSCRQYLENIEAARAAVGEGAPRIDKLPAFYDRPGFIEACADRVHQALGRFLPNEPNSVRLAFSAHSIPCSMAQASAYEGQLRLTASAVAKRTQFDRWDLVFQSRSGPPSQPWLGPDILDYLRTAHGEGARRVLVSPLGFISDHLEVLYDLDVEAARLANELGMTFVRAATAGTHPAFVHMIRDLIMEPRPAPCREDCCPAPSRAGRPPASVGPSALRRA